jgi:hypothetical protein
MDEGRAPEKFLLQGPKGAQEKRGGQNIELSPLGFIFKYFGEKVPVLS